MNKSHGWFKAKSKVDIDCCISTMDGILIWINKPSISDQMEIKFGPKKSSAVGKYRMG